MYKVILILDLFLKYEGDGVGVGGGGDQIDPPPEKATLKKASVIRVKAA